MLISGQILKTLSLRATEGKAERLLRRRPRLPLPPAAPGTEGGRAAVACPGHAQSRTEYSRIPVPSRGEEACVGHGNIGELTPGV